MAVFLNRIIREMIFWMAWIIIPISVEIIPAIGGFIILVKKRLTKKENAIPERYPEITLIIPVYNSADTLKNCLKSVLEAEYPRDKISIILSNNESTDNSFEVFCTCQEMYPDVEMRWINAEQGKAKALNMALFNSNGKYIIHIDSDGILHPLALRNMVRRFEENYQIHCMTGAVLTNIDLIEETPSFFMRLIRRSEFYEYCQAFLAGRNFESELGHIYTLSGAFSAFRKSAILKTQLYSTETVCEDTHVTFQIRKLLKEDIHLCENAFFFVEPIESMDKLYTQRQRWQRGEIEVAHMFLVGNKKKGTERRLRFANRLLMTDHTFAFPRMIWYFAIIFLVFLNYPLKLIIGSVFIIYLLYVFSAFLFYLNVRSYLSIDKKLKKYYCSKKHLLFFMPIFNFYTFWIRFAGIINCIRGEGMWKTLTFPEEWVRVKNEIMHDFKGFINLIRKIRRGINHE